MLRFDIGRLMYWITLMLTATIFLTFYYANWSFTTDDALITLRYSKNLASGEGIVWNIDDPKPVEGYSNFIFMILGAVFEKTAAEHSIVLIKIMNFFAAMGVLFAAFRLSRFWVPPNFAILAPFIIVLHQGFTLWADSGLETPVYMLAVFLSILLFLRASEYQFVKQPAVISNRALLFGLSGLMACIVALLRPEGGLIFICLIATLLYEQILSCKTISLNIFKQRPFWIVLLCFSIPYLIYAIWHFWYFGKLLPNTVYCKMGFTGDKLKVIKNFLPVGAPLFLMSIIGIKHLTNPKSFLLVIIVVLNVSIMYGVDPIMAHYDRHLLTAFSLLVVLALYSFYQILSKFNYPEKKFAILLFVFFVWLFAGYNIMETATKMKRQATDYSIKMNLRKKIGHYLNDNLDKRAWIAVGDCGMIPYVSHSNIIDLYCLNSTAYVEPPISKKVDRFVDYLLNQCPEVIILISNSSKHFRPRYSINQVIFDSPVFQQKYRRARIIGHQMHYYWIYFKTNTLLH